MYNHEGMIRVSFIEPTAITEANTPHITQPVYNYDFLCTGYRILHPRDCMKDNEVKVLVLVGQTIVPVAVRVEAKKNV